MLNKYPNRIIAIIFFISVQHLFTDAQEINYRIDKMTVENGLSNNTVRSIIQDDQGFLWFGTESGLNRYDGSNFKIYYNNPNDSNSLSTNMIKNIFKDADGSLWIVTSLGGLNKFNIKFNEITLFIYEYYVSDSLNLNIFKKAAVIDKDNMLWFSYGHNGLYSVDLNTTKLKLYKHQKSDKNSISSNNIRSLFVDKEGIICIGTDEGVLNKYNKKNQEFTHFKIREF